MSPPASIRHGPLSFTLPEGWVDTSQVVALGPEEQGFRSNLVVSIEPVQSGETALRLATRRLPEVRRMASGFELVSEEAARYGGKEGVLREHTFVMEGLRVAQLQFYTVKGSVGFTFTYTQRADRLPKSRALAEQLFTTARVDGGLEVLRSGPLRV